MENNRIETAFLIDSLSSARKAVTMNSSKNLILISSRIATAYTGGRYFIEIYKILLSEENELNISMWIDCGSNIGIALNSIREGAKNIIFRGLNEESISQMLYKVGGKCINESPWKLNKSLVDINLTKHF
ncbi:hypothetical protein OAK17_02350 [Alphaproteobacteria bacterium]|nr:hypothetical protein [Alphaproteobacteria bacterium]